MSERILITAALPYANGALHFGHFAGAYLPADIYARFERLQGHEVLFICGSDEYGVAVTLSAEAAGRKPQQHVDEFHAVNRQLFEQLGISVDHFGRTTAPGHAELTQQFFLDLLKNGFIEERDSQQLYSVQEGRFLADRYVVGTCPKCGYPQARGDECPSCGGSFEATDLKEPRSKISGSALELRPTRHWYLRFDLLQGRLQEWFGQKKWKNNVLQFARHYIEDLKPRAITRDLSWGIPVPLEGAQDKVFYVWFDAPIGYLSITQEWARLQGTPDRWKEFWLEPSTRLVQFIGKDNIPFHAIFFPAMCMGQNLPVKLVDELPANEFYQLEGRQFSKSEGWTIDLANFIQSYGIDPTRYMLAATAPEHADSEFTWREFQLRCNSELLGKFGNLAQRVLVFAQQHCDGKVPEEGQLEPIDLEFLHQCEQLTAQAAEEYRHFKVREATQTLMALAQLGNGYFDANKPWQAIKQNKMERVTTTIRCCLECLKLMALVSDPIMPATAQSLWQMLGLPNRLSDLSWKEIVALDFRAGRALGSPQHLFRKIEDVQIEGETAKLKQSLVSLAKPEQKKELAGQPTPPAANATAPQPTLAPTITFD
ncbi:MAG: methionine--tRNA ligase, partial [Chlamydiia bacterium]